MVWYAQLFQNFPQFIVIYTIKGFGIVNKAEIDVFLELSCFFMFQSIKVSQKQCLVLVLKGEQSFVFMLRQVNDIYL